MRERIYYFVKLYIFWLLYFQVMRLVFVAYEPNSINFNETLLACLYGLKLDISMSSYLMILPVLVLIVDSIIAPWKHPKKIIKAYITILLIIISFVHLLDAKVYTYWGYKLDASVFQFLDQPGIILASLNLLDIVIPIAIMLGIYFTARYIFVKIIPPTPFKTPSSISSLLFFVFIASTIFIPIRGGFSIAPLRLGIPINVGTVYFSSDNHFANHVAVNTTWNFVSSMTRGTSKGYQANYMSDDEATSIVKELYKKRSNKVELLNTDKPNILLIVWESATAKIIKDLDGDSSVTPNFNRLVKEGVFFNHFFANGDRSDKGMVALLSGFPTQPTTSIIKEDHKMQQLPFIMGDLKKSKNYFTSFYYGGEIDFANFRSYFTHGGTDQIKSKLDYDAELYNSKWGVHDEHMFKSLLKDIPEMPQPFFSTFFTLSSHEPFDVPHKSEFVGTDRKNKFFNSAHYTDEQLGQFIAKAKTQDWWDNTLVIITADHGIFLKGMVGHNPEKFHIPMLWLGGALAKTDTVINTYANQTDLPTTLLAQTNTMGSHYPFSRNLLGLDQEESFGYYVFSNGFGVCNDSSLYVYWNDGQKVLSPDSLYRQQLQEQGEAIFQETCKTFDEY